MAHILFHIAVFLSAFLLSNVVWKYLNSESQYCVIETTAGIIRGKQNRTLLDGKLFFSFRGIPFAKPPIDDLRFKAPQLAEPWSGTFDAFEFGKNCFGHISGDIFEGYEDCLYLNVYVPTNSTTVDTNAKLPVMFYIYGGRFVTGMTNHYAPDFLMEENMIVVTSNYRVGPFGFLSLNLPEYSGNMGLKDQALALKWVHENIGYFGGDRNQITMCGHSSGSSSTNLHMISPHSNHLFKRAIMMSGSALNSDLIQTSNQNDDLYKLAKELNYSVSNKDDLIEFLHEVDAQLLLKRTFQPMMIPANGTKELSHGWTLTIEDKSSLNPFLTETPFDILTHPNYKSDIDAIFSSAPTELVLMDEQIHPELLKLLDEVFEFDLPLSHTNIDFKSATYKEMAKRIRQFYFDGKSIRAENIERVHSLISDTVMLYGIDLAARIQAKKSNARTLYSKFTADNEWNFSARKRKESNYTIRFDDHPDQVYYLHWFSFDGPNEIYQGLKSNPLPRSIVKNVAKFYGNFAKFGYVMSNSEPVAFNTPNSNQFKYYDITNDGIFVKVDNRKTMEFWNQLFNEFRGHWNITFNFQKLQHDQLKS